MAERFFHTELAPGELRLEEGEAHHVRVSRLQRGDRITLFDGRGHEATGVIVACGRREVVVRVDSVEEVSRELNGTLVLYAPLPQGDRQRWLVEKATELGVARFVPLITSRADAHSRTVKRERLNRWIIEACKQCGRNVLMEVADPLEWTTAAEVAPGTRFFCHPANRFLWQCGSGGVHYDQVSIAVGPEGGWTAEEIELARARGWTICGLGPTILRVETAALAACVVARSWLLMPRASHGNESEG